MPSKDRFLLADDAERLAETLRRLCEDGRARAAFLVDRNGRLMASTGDVADLDTTSLASLVAGSIAATSSLAQLLGEQGFSGMFHEGGRAQLYLAVVGGESILVVLFDQRSSVGLVRFRVKLAGAEVARILEEVADRGRKSGPPAPATPQGDLAQITDEEIDNLLSS